MQKSQKLSSYENRSLEQRAKKRLLRAKPQLRGRINKTIGKLEFVTLAAGSGLLLIVIAALLTDFANLGRTGLNVLILPGLFAVLYAFARLLK